MRSVSSHTIVLFALLLAFRVQAQSLSVYAIDRSAPPQVTAKLVAFDASGNRITDLTKNDIFITENTISCNVISITCPPVKPPEPASIAIGFDASGSMEQEFSGKTSLEFAKSSAENLVNALTLPPSEVAVQASSDFAAIYTDFTTDRTRAVKAVQDVDITGGTNYHTLLLDPYAGLLHIAKRGKHARAAVMLADAYYSQLRDDKLQECIDICKQNNIRFYCALFNDQRDNMNGARISLQKLASATGGWMREGVISEQASADLANELAAAVGGSDPCDLVWESPKNCDPLIEIVITIPRYGLSTTISYINPDADGYTEIQPMSLRFGRVTPPLSGNRTVRILARTADVQVRSITTNHPVFTVEALSYPFTIPRDGYRDITVYYTPVDSTFVSGFLRIMSDLCEDSSGTSIPISGGLPPTRSLKIVKPMGGEEFVVGEDTVIRWIGVDPSDGVKLEYTTDGTTWSTIADSAFGLEYDWRVPMPPSTTCRIRASLVEPRLANSYDFTLVNRYRVFDSLKLSPTYAEGDLGGIVVSAGGVHLYDALTAQLNYSYTNVATTALVPPVAGNQLVIGCGGTTLFGFETYGSHLSWSKTSQKFTSLTSAFPAAASIATTTEKGPTQLWSMSGNEQCKLWGHLGDAVSVVFDDDAQRVATVGTDMTARIWSGQCAEINKFDLAGRGSGVIFDPTGKYLITTTENGILERWDIATGAVDNTLDLGMTLPNRLKFSESGSTLIVGSNANAKGRVLADSGGRLAVALNIGDGFSNWQNKAPMTKDGNIILMRDPLDATRIAAWSMKGSMFVGVLPHPRLPRSAVFSSDERHVVTTTDQEAFLWEVSSFADSGRKVDTSKIFTVVAPQAASLDVDMGEVLIGAKKDSVITAYLVNTGTYKVRVDSVTITGTDAADFYLQSAPQSIIEVGTSAPVEFSFVPTANGLRRATVQIHARSGLLQQSIIGTGTSPFIQTLGNVVDFGIHPVGATYDSTVALAVKNVGTTPVDITSTTLLGPDVDQFSILSGGGSFTLQPGASQTMVLRFAPQYLGRTSSAIGFAYNGPGSPAILRLFGQGIGGTVYIPDDSAAAGDIVNIVVLLSGPKSYIQNDGATKFSAEISFDATLLTPVEAFARGTIQNGLQTISLNDIWGAANDTLAVIPMRVGLGASESTIVGIPSFTWLDDFDKVVPLAIDVIPGSFKLLGICEEGGKRLFNPDGQISMQIQPNPAQGGSMTIRYETIEHGLTKLRMYNALGEVVHEKTSEESGVHIVTVNTDELSAGSYYCILETPTARIHRLVFVSK